MAQISTTMKKRILIDATNVDITRPGGGSFCVRAYIEALINIYPGLIDVMHPKEANIRDPRYTTIDVAQRSKKKAILGGIKGFFHRGGPFIVDYIKQHENIYHTVFINIGLFAGGVVEKIKQTSLRVVVIHHNFEPEYRMASRSVLTLYGRTSAIVKYWERKSYKNADLNLFLTAADCTTFENEYGKRENNYVTGVFEPTPQRQTCTTATTQTAVITCALGDRQNQASLMQFISYYMPAFLRVLPEWEVIMMGRHPSAKLTQAVTSVDNMSIIPNPKDICALAAKSCIYLCPMDTGGGFKLRIMDGLRMGQPVLVHERSARGYEELSDKPFFKTYTNVEEFEERLQGITTFMQSPAYSRENVQDAYYSLFGLEKGTERLKTILCH